jgi:hypothetical protein
MLPKGAEQAGSAGNVQMIDTAKSHCLSADRNDGMKAAHAEVERMLDFLSCGFELPSFFPRGVRQSGQIR